MENEGGGGGGGGGVEGSCVRHSCSGRGLELVFPLDSHSRPIPQDVRAARWKRPTTTCFCFSSCGSFRDLLVKYISPIVCCFVFFYFCFPHLNNPCEQTEYKRAGSCSVIYNSKCGKGM